MKKTFKSKLTVFLSLIFIFTALFCNVTFKNKVYAEDVDAVAEKRSTLYMQVMYDVFDVDCENADVLYSSRLYGLNDETVAQATVFKRDGTYDYVVYNCITEDIDEFCFETESALSMFPREGINYYGGILEYFTKVGDCYISTSTQQILSEEQFTQRLMAVRMQLETRREQIQLYDGRPDNGAEGISNWSSFEIIMQQQGWELSAYTFVDGITFSGVSPYIHFENTNTFNVDGTLTNHCAPTAMTNLMIYYNCCGLPNVLLNNSIYDTFTILKSFAHHSNNNGTNRSNALTALRLYLGVFCRYVPEIEEIGNDWNDVFNELSQNYALYTSLRVEQSDGNTWGHAVLTMGCMEIAGPNGTQIFHLKYHRIIDGWATSNSGRYIGHSSFYDDIYNATIRLDVRDYVS